MRAVAALAALAALAACDPPPLKIAFQVSGGPTQACPAAGMSASPSCSDVPMLCDAVLNIRIVRPTTPQETYVPVCEEIPPTRDRDLCSIENIDLPPSELPKDTLEVQVLIWPRDAVKVDPDTGALDCREIYGQPVLIGFGIDGFPEDVVPSPALGGRAYYHPGDEQTVVTLGCSDLAAVNRPVCVGAAGVQIGGAVNDFERPTRSIARTMVNDLAVSVGEPVYDGDQYRMENTSALALAAPQGSEDPRWSGVVPGLMDSLCVQVIGTSGANTATVRCDLVSPTQRLDVTGFWLRPELLGEIVTGLGLGRLPPQGLTIGLVLDPQGRPASGYEVTSLPGTPISYLTADHQVVPGGGSTTSSGLFVSEAALYGTSFTARNSTLSLTAAGIGGLVRGRVTIVILQLAPVAG
jgi:hypothetical protein